MESDILHVSSLGNHCGAYKYRYKRSSLQLSMYNPIVSSNDRHLVVSPIPVCIYPIYDIQSVYMQFCNSGSTAETEEKSFRRRCCRSIVSYGTHLLSDNRYIANRSVIYCHSPHTLLTYTHTPIYITLCLCLSLLLKYRCHSSPL